MVNKKAQGHVEMVLATVLFVGFLIFIFIFLTTGLRSNEFSILEIQEQTLELVKSDIGKLPVITQTTDDCYYLDEVNDEYGPNYVEVHDLQNPRRYTIYYGNFFDPALIGQTDCTTQKPQEEWNFSFGVYTEENIIIEEKIKELKNSYEQGSVEIDDFSFEFRDLTGSVVSEISVQPSIPDNLDVFSKELAVRVIDDQAKIKELTMIIKAWR